MSSPQAFHGDHVRVVCISDTHNDDCTGSLPDGDILIHAGDMTDDGTMDELRTAYNWIAALPHKVKVIVAGNHDLGLDRGHKSFLPEALELFTSKAARSAGICYVDRAVQPVASFQATGSDAIRQLAVYGNPAQPDFLKSSYAFTYLPYPSEQATSAWEGVPARGSAPIWVTHGPPQGRLDWIPIPPLEGCAVQARATAHARPILSVFGHYHISHGVELVSWKEDSDEVAKVDVLVKDGAPCSLDFTSAELAFEPGEKTIFVNAAWMTLKKTEVEERYQPVVLDLPVRMLT